jgi:hypothetical protein
MKQKMGGVLDNETNANRAASTNKWSCALTEHHAMRAYWGSGDIAPRFLDPGTRARCKVPVPEQYHAMKAYWDVEL